MLVLITRVLFVTAVDLPFIPPPNPFHSFVFVFRRTLNLPNIFWGLKVIIRKKWPIRHVEITITIIIFQVITPFDPASRPRTSHETVKRIEKVDTSRPENVVFELRARRACVHSSPRSIV